MMKDNEDSITIGEYEIIPNKLIIKLETGIEGFKRLCQFKLDRIQEIRYYDSKFYFIYNSDIADSLISATWGNDKLRFDVESSLEIKFFNKQNLYLRGVFIFRASLGLKEISKDGTLIVEVI